MDQDTWRFINTFAPWASALGTVGAVITSLYLARRSDRQKLEVGVGLRKLGAIKHDAQTGYVPQVFLRPKVFNVSADWLVVSVTNVGRRTVSLAHLYWQSLGCGRPAFVWTPLLNRCSSKFPITLADGEPAYYAWPLAQFEQQFRQTFDDEFQGALGASRLCLLRICVGTSTGHVFRHKPEQELLQLFKKLANEKIPSPPAATA